MNIVILDSKTLGSDIDLSILKAFGELTIYETTTESKVVERIRDAEIIITNKVLLNESNLNVCSNLKLICLTATGTNNVDLNYTKNRGIVVTNVAGYSTNSVVQHTFASLLYILENLRYYDEYVKSGQYANSEIFTHIGKNFWELTNKTFGIIGLGEIGRGVAAVAEAFGAKVIYYSTSGKNSNSSYKRVELNQLLMESDVVTIHCPLNELTRNLIDYKELKIMKNTAILLNMGRGGIINEESLAKALDEHLILGAGLDVISKEPIEENNPLMQVKNSNRLFITPHIAWASIEARQKLILEVYKNIDSFLKNEERNRV
ncbi:D-2-hydroxyacid dehydrogenase [Clostridium manihotivorum]|uniref:Hydroxyacid dehydrogenase n=1 Tax=Clostridium manihotivorum TaxID=2320868 RepID=A0A410DYW0_9CLOT|nr:D-2-hydroxyacid dehydrogenase [Clostridium manihotivorum]QAA34273.1 hydroxyacid dehydrogenase [Clostridium manihotivorum]